MSVMSAQSLAGWGNAIEVLESNGLLSDVRGGESGVSVDSLVGKLYPSAPSNIKRASESDAAVAETPMGDAAARTVAEPAAAGGMTPVTADKPSAAATQPKAKQVLPVAAKEPPAVAKEPPAASHQPQNGDDGEAPAPSDDRYGTGDAEAYAPQPHVAPTNPQRVLVPRVQPARHSGARAAKHVPAAHGGFDYPQIPVMRPNVRGISSQVRRVRVWVDMLNPVTGGVLKRAQVEVKDGIVRIPSMLCPKMYGLPGGVDHLDIPYSGNGGIRLDMEFAPSDEYAREIASASLAQLGRFSVSPDDSAPRAFARCIAVVSSASRTSIEGMLGNGRRRIGSAKVRVQPSGNGDFHAMSSFLYSGELADSAIVAKATARLVEKTDIAALMADPSITEIVIADISLIKNPVKNSLFTNTRVLGLSCALVFRSAQGISTDGQNVLS